MPYYYSLTMVGNLYYFIRLHGRGKGQTDKKILHFVVYCNYCSLMLKTIHLPQPWKAFPQPYVLLQRPGTPQSPVAFEVFEVSVGETGVFETKVPLRHLSAKSPSPPLETKGCFQSAMVFSFLWKKRHPELLMLQGQGPRVTWFVRIRVGRRFLNFHASHSLMFPYQPERWSIMAPKASKVHGVFRCPYSYSKNLR